MNAIDIKPAIHLTPEDTYYMMCDSTHYGSHQFGYENETTVHREDDGYLMDWRMTVIEHGGDGGPPDEPATCTVSHQAWLDVLAAVAEGRFEVGGQADYTVRQVVSAPDHQTATDEMRQLDYIDYDYLAQLIVLGQIKY